MAQRLIDAKKWLWIMVIYASPTWTPVQCVTVKNPPKTPSTIEAQAKFFQDFFSVQLSPHNIEFGHVCEDPDTWEQRYEKKDFKNHRDMGKVRWGDKKGGYGEHYWDLNHAGHTGDHDSGYEGNSDDGSYREEHNNDIYEEPSDYSPAYDAYDPEKASKFDDINRTKRAHPRTKNEKKTYKVYDEEEDNGRTLTSTKRKRVEQNRPEKMNDQTLYRKTLTAKQHNNYDHSDEAQDDSEEYEPESEEDNKERKQVVLVLSQKEKGDYRDNPNQQHNAEQYDAENTQEVAPQQPRKQNSLNQNFQRSHFAPQDSQQFNPVAPQQFAPQKFAPQSQPSYVPYEGGAGLREHQQPETSASAAVTRLFLEPSTGHIIDRATGRAYVLQPLAPNYE